MTTDDLSRSIAPGTDAAQEAWGNHADPNFPHLPDEPDEFEVEHGQIGVPSSMQPGLPGEGSSDDNGVGAQTGEQPVKRGIHRRQALRKLVELTLGATGAEQAVRGALAAGAAGAFLAEKGQADGTAERLATTQKAIADGMTQEATRYTAGVTLLKLVDGVDTSKEIDITTMENKVAAIARPLAESADYFTDPLNTFRRAVGEFDHLLGSGKSHNETGLFAAAGMAAKTLNSSGVNPEWAASYQKLDQAMRCLGDISGLAWIAFQFDHDPHGATATAISKRVDVLADQNHIDKEQILVDHGQVKGGGDLSVQRPLTVASEIIATVLREVADETEGYITASQAVNAPSDGPQQ